MIMQVCYDQCGLDNPSCALRVYSVVLKNKFAQCAGISRRCHRGEVHLVQDHGAFDSRNYGLYS